jgi:hypothetical protein
MRSPVPERIQLRRTKGYRKPEGAIYVGRSSRWGNPFRVGDPHPIFGWKMNAEECVYYYRALVERHPLLMQAMDGSLRGHDLACWCPLNHPCHADVLLELVNG